MPLPSNLLSDLEDMPRQLEQALALIPGDRLGRSPAGETQQHLAGIQWLAGKIASAG